MTSEENTVDVSGNDEVLFPAEMLCKLSAACDCYGRGPSVRFVFYETLILRSIISLYFCNHCNKNSHKTDTGYFGRLLVCNIAAHALHLHKKKE